MSVMIGFVVKPKKLPCVVMPKKLAVSVMIGFFVMPKKLPCRS